MTKYEHNCIRESLQNKSISIKYKLLEKSMIQKHKMDYLFVKHIFMINNIHKNTEKNLKKLEKNRKKIRDELYNLKKNYNSMKSKLHLWNFQMNTKIKFYKKNIYYYIIYIYE